MTHTPGPWTANTQAGRWFVNASTLYNLASVGDEANARLIAAAPDMLRALTIAVEDGQVSQAWIQRAHAILTRITPTPGKDGK